MVFNSTISNKSLLMLGGGKSQLAFAEATKKLDMYLTVVDMDPMAPARVFADQFVGKSIHSPDGILDCVGANFNGILCYSSHPEAQKTAAFLRDKIGCCGSGEVLTEVLLDKSKWSKLLSAERLNVPRVYQVQKHREGLEFPLVAKPKKDSSGSQGVVVLWTQDEIEAHIVKSDQYIYQQFISGDEYNVSGVVVGGRLIPLAISRKFVSSSYLPVAFELLRMDEPSWARLYRVAQKAITALNIDYSPISLDLMLSGDQIYVLDVGALMDAKIDRLLCQVGSSPYQALVSAALGGEPSSPPCNTSGWLRFLYPGVGGLHLSRRKMDHVESALPQGVKMEWEKKSGEYIKAPQSLSDTLGWLISCKENSQLKADESKDLIERIESILSGKTN